MLLKVIQVGDDALRMPAKKVTPEQLKAGTTQQLIDLMIATLRDKPGIGLAAPQVGESLRIIVIEDKKQYHTKLNPELLKIQNRKPVALKVIVNPVIQVIDETINTFFEGCLSVDGYRALVPRANKLQVTGLDRTGDSISFAAEGWSARIIQHEVDHLDGIVYVDKMHSKSFMTEGNYSKNWSEAPPASINELIC